MRPASIREAIDQLGISGREQDGEITARCPLHADSSPSFRVNTENGLWICHAGCGKGNIRQLASQILHLEGNDLRLWTSKLGLSTPQLRATTAGVDQVTRVDEEAFINVTRCPPGEQLAKRRITEHAAEELTIRFNPHNPLKDNKGPGGDPCWMIPLRHPTEHYLIGWQSKGTVSGQAITTGRKSATLFGIEWVTPGQDLVVVESPLDVARLSTCGVENAVATFGTSISSDQVSLIAGFLSAGGRLIEALDNDEAGRKAAKRLLAAKVFKAFPRVSFDYGTSPGKDPGEMTLEEIRAGMAGAC